MECRFIPLFDIARSVEVLYGASLRSTQRGFKPSVFAENLCTGEERQVVTVDEKKNNFGTAVHELTPAERSKGGHESVKTRRKKKTMKQALDMLLQLPINSEEDFSLLSELGVDISALDESELVNMLIVTAALFKEAKQGNVRAITAIKDIIGEDSNYTKHRMKMDKEHLKIKQKLAEDDW